ncbi:MAG TPA: DUF262 domain-containing protein [Rhodocyclaceae bacterium]|nr:DUF262 domain-containing protein [Rhodocyclaceae bacterium]
MTSSKHLTEDLADEGVPSGVEHEDEAFKNHEPFDPASISLSSKVVALDAVLRRIKNGTIVLTPDFQRNQVWDVERKSLLIESMMLRIPLPMFYVSEDKDGVWEVVDGLQRLTTIRDFILGPDGDGKGFKIKHLEFWGELFNGKDFYSIEKKSNMPRVINNIMEAELSFTVINPDTPEKVKRNIFKRINTGGMRLSSQEIRHALYQGKSTRLLKELTLTDSYERIMAKTIKDDRMAGRELILRYLAFHLLGRKAYRGDMDEFLSNTMRHLNGDITIETEQNYSNDKIIDEFDKALERAYEIFGDHAFRRSRGNLRKTPINKSLFDVLMYCLTRASNETFNRIKTNKTDFEKKFHSILSNDEFSESIGRYGADPLGVKHRYSTLIELFKEYSHA